MGNKNIKSSSRKDAVDDVTTIGLGEGIAGCEIEIKDEDRGVYENYRLNEVNEKDNKGAILLEGTNPLIKTINDLSKFQELLKITASEGKVVVANFHAPWVTVCQTMDPKFLKLANEFGNVAAVFTKINVDDNDELANHYRISCMPTFLIFLKGEKVGEMSGANVEHLRNLIISNTNANQGPPNSA